MVAAHDVAVDLDSGHVCALCDERINMLDEALCLEVVLPAKPADVEYYILEDNEGNYAYEPYFFHLTCWVEEVEGQLNDSIEDDAPVLDSSGIVECEGCTSDILAWETCGTVTVGEFKYLEQSQDGAYEPRFVPYPGIKSRPFCVACLSRINTEILEMWPEGVTHLGACEDGVACRCWRYGSCNDPGQPHCRLFDNVDG